MRATRTVLLLTLAATIAATIGLAVESNVTRGPALSFVLVPEQPATGAQLDIDGAALVRRLQSLGFQDTSAGVKGDSIELTMYGSAPQLRNALQGALAPASLQVRPVECAAPLFTPAAPSGISTASSSEPMSYTCGSRYVLGANALRVDTNTGNPTRRIAADPTFAPDTSTSEAQNRASATILLPTASASGFGGERLVAGPAEVVNADVISVKAIHQAPEWNLDVDLTASGTTRYNSLAKGQFHAYIAIAIDGTVISAPIIEPLSTSFASLGSTLDISADLTKSQAIDLADDLTSPLAVPLQLVR
jgi:hypothetical protein